MCVFQLHACLCTSVKMRNLSCVCVSVCIGGVGGDKFCFFVLWAFVIENLNKANINEEMYILS